MIFLAEDTLQSFPTWFFASRDLSRKPPILSIAMPVPVETGIEKQLQEADDRAIIVSQPTFFRMRRRGLQLNGTALFWAPIRRMQPLVMRRVLVIVTNHATVDLAREAATALVATKIAFINELRGLSEHVDGGCLDHRSLTPGGPKPL